MRHSVPRLFVLLFALAPGLALSQTVTMGSGGSQKRTERNFVKWVDAKGTLNFTDDPNKIPPEYRAQAESIDPRQAVEPRSKTTSFSFRPGIKQIVVAARLNDHVTVKMWVDPAATQTVLSVAAAKELGITPTDPAHKKVDIILGGEKFNVPLVKVETIDIQGRVARNIYAVVSDFADTENYVGILGQDFLDHFKVIFDQAGGRFVLEEKH